MVQRPYLGKGIKELETLYEKRGGSPNILQALQDELSHRKTERARCLLRKVSEKIYSERYISESSSQEYTKASQIELIPEPDVIPDPLLTQSKISLDAYYKSNSNRQATPPITNEPTNILSTWIALEVLSPKTFKRPEDILDGNKSNVVLLDSHHLPWENGGEKSQPKKRLYYHVVLGAMKMDVANRLLLQSFSDDRIEKKDARDFSCFAILTLDQKGRLVEENGVAVSSFSWAFPLACRNQLEQLGQWHSVEADVNKHLTDILLQHDEEGGAIPLTNDHISTAFTWLAEHFDIRQELLERPMFALRKHHWYKIKNPPEPPLLNSFFLDDLEKARQLISKQGCGNSLSRYLGLETPQTRNDLLRDKVPLEQISAPSLIPRGRWPGKGRYPLVLLQQAAVNLAKRDLVEGGVIGINGPPGTGKTTLLRDIVASVLVDRAVALATFQDPEKAFVHSEEKIKIYQSFVHLYKLSSDIKGHEIVVASSNNKAVENISKELPGKDAIAEDVDLSYFRTISDAWAGNENTTWGTIAAVLGNSSNLYAFQKGFWDNDDTSLKHYLRQVSGGNVAPIVETNEISGKPEERLPKIITSERPPIGHSESLQKWKQAKQAFETAYEEANKALLELENVRKIIHEIPIFNATLDELTTKLDDVLTKAEGYAGQHPGFFSWLFQTQRWKLWKEENLLREKIGQVQHGRDARHDKLTKRKYLFGEHLANREFWEQEHSDLQKSSPWLSEYTQRLRDEVFIAAVELHKAFIDAAAKPIRHNLMALMSELRGSGLGDKKRDHLLPDLWSTLFLVTPVISTTFASVEKMFGKLPIETFGWLLVDEAGQAVPQAAVGAIMRSKRAMIVGDPLQIEPVVTLQPTLVNAICREYGVEPEEWSAPKSSAQYLADTASPYGGELQKEFGEMWIGSPLLVHRRCDNPMFKISNCVAYDGLMVHGKTFKSSPIREVLGPSKWIDVRGSGNTKWCSTSGREALQLLYQLKEIGLSSPDVYIISPFRVVMQEMRKAVTKQRELLDGWPDDWVTERIGTVHTFQGKESEAVIFLLGAPDESQKGARAWAGSSPNILNVAATRAKSCLYVIGNRDLWKEHGSFKELDRHLR